ncbi:MAG TPA: hypothetical protein VHM88_08510 [Candidatus Acidoferrales bacterium]|nr:hypothetical protein [Candidatus Acidoferrales bacterium]
MNPAAVFGISVAMSLVSSGVAAAVYAWPRLRIIDRRQALASLVAPHMFLRFIGLSVLVPGVVSPLLPAAWAVPAAYGDFVTGILAIIATAALSKRVSWAVAAVWLFNVWGTSDFVYAFLEGPQVLTDVGRLGAAFFIPTAVVPPLFVTHVLLFLLLLRPSHEPVVERADTGPLFVPGR